jgi:N-acetyl-anhydromuramyl-L-alanine amidase AmpD
MDKVKLRQPLNQNVGPTKYKQRKEKGMPSILDKRGMLFESRVRQRRFLGIEHGDLDVVRAIVVHQTDGGSAQDAFNSYLAGGNGAHFLIDKDGTIYQTASLNKRCYHVGRLIRSKCLTLDRKTCNSESMAKILAMSWTRQINALDAHERYKDYPARYPVNSDSIGIELVGKHLDDKTFETVTIAQNASLQWLVDELSRQFLLTANDVYRHPEVSYKNLGEARTAKWK